MWKWLMDAARQPVARALVARIVVALIGALLGLLADAGLLGGELSDALHVALQDALSGW